MPPGPSGIIEDGGQNRVAEWLVGLTGDRFDLEELATYLRSPDYTVVELEGRYYLKSPSFGPLAGAEEIRQAAIEVLQVVNGFGKLLLTGHFQPVGIADLNRVSEDGRRDVWVLPSALDLRLRLMPVNATTGDSTPDVRLPTLLESWLTTALGHRRVADAVRYFGSTGPRWVNLSKVYDVIEEDVGGEPDIIARGWATGRKLRLFRSTANNKRSIGDDARHGHEKWSAPERPMALPEAETLIRSILEHWIRSKNSSG
jgi:hypothetical protein